MPETGEIVCYLHNGASFVVPNDVFLSKTKRFQTAIQVADWIGKRDKAVKKHPNSLASVLGSSICDSSLSLVEQIVQALK